ncbi:MAG: hypothetical protein JO257_05165 [Deltaproteobacteria bacterium]|nr:hypothetical protein [Deltaproteobacteria bacterium]
MRTVLLAVIALSSPAFADRTGGVHPSGGGSGPLGQVSAGLAGAAASSGAQGSSGTTGSNSILDRAEGCRRYLGARERDPAYRNTIYDHDCSGYALQADASVHQNVDGGFASSDPGATVTGFAGAQKVIGSDGSFSLALAVVDRRLRLDGSVTQYYENEMSGARVTMMAPEISAGIHLGADAPTRVWLQTGVMYLSTSDPAGSTSNAGPTIGARIEHRASNDLTIAGTVEAAYLQDGVHGVAGRVGVRFHHVEAALRVLDLDVGPALYGPELGVGF